MWDTVEPRVGAEHLSHDLPCQQCGHAAHVYLPCDHACGCVPALVLVGAAVR